MRSAMVRSSTRFAIGPTWLMIACCPIGRPWPQRSGVRPAVGRIEVMPQNAAGMRSEPPMSLPRPSGEAPAAISAASPPLLPPHDRSTFHGLLVRP
jgi:hypothetical protein